MDLTGVGYFNIGGNNVTGTIPSAIGRLTNLAYLAMDNNLLTGSIPTEILQLKQLTFIGLGTNPYLTGTLPAFDFSKFTNCCNMRDCDFTCPLPPGAETCVGGPAQGCLRQQDPPTCKRA
jgi:hypothetical protein